MSEEQKRVSLLKVETGLARFKWKPFNIKFRFYKQAERKLLARDSDWTCLILRFQVKCLSWFCDFSRLLDFIELKIGFRLKSDF